MSVQRLTHEQHTRVWLDNISYGQRQIQRTGTGATSVPELGVIIDIQDEDEDARRRGHTQLHC